MKTVVVWDLDGTLFDNRHRQHYIAAKPKNWKAFFQEIPFDEPFPQMISTVTFLQNQGFECHFVTARPISTLHATRAQLQTYIHRPGDLDHLLHMRAADDHRVDVEVKQDIIWQMFRDGLNVVAAYDDRVEVCNMYAAFGIKAHVCVNGVVDYIVDDTPSNVLDQIFRT